MPDYTFLRHSRESGNTAASPASSNTKQARAKKNSGIPAFAGMTALYLAGIYLLAYPLAAQTPAAPTPIEAPSPDRIEAATELLEILMPPDRREAMVLEMLGPMMQNLEQGMMQSPQFQSAFENPEAQALFAQFMARQRARSIEQMRTSLPGMFDAMARAYARRFTERQMRQIGNFFETDTGQTYLREANTIMADPDVAAWQRNAMMQSMGNIQQDIAEFATQIAALEGGADGSGRAATQQEEAPATNRLLDAMRGGGEAAEELPEGEE